MAKKVHALNISLLASFLHAHNGIVYLNQADAMPFLQHTPALIEVNTGITDPQDPSKAAARLSEAGKAYVAEHTVKATPVAGNGATTAFAIISGVELPKSKRGNRGGGAPIKYPFDTLEIGQGFFVPATEKHPEPVKSLGSTISSANMRFAEDTGETKTVERTKRGPGNKKVVENGVTVKETVTIPVYRHTRKFVIRAIEAGKVYGNWTAPANGAFISRVELS